MGEPDDRQALVEERHVEPHVQIVTIICLTIIISISIIGITVTAIFTDRNVHYAEGLSFAGAVLIAVIGGFTIRHVRRRRRWKIEREENGDDR